MWPFQQIGDPKLRNHLFRAVQLVKNADIDKYKYSGYGIGLRQKEHFHFLMVLDLVILKINWNIIVFDADTSSFVHVDNKKKDILILGKGPTDRLIRWYNADYWERILYQFYRAKKEIVWVYTTMEQIVLYLLMKLKFKNSKQKNPFCHCSSIMSRKIFQMTFQLIIWKDWIIWICLQFSWWLWCFCWWRYIRHSQVFNENEWYIGGAE